MLIQKSKEINQKEQIDVFISINFIIIQALKQIINEKNKTIESLENENKSLKETIFKYNILYIIKLLYYRISKYKNKDNINFNFEENKDDKIVSPSNSTSSSSNSITSEYSCQSTIKVGDSPIYSVKVSPYGKNIAVGSYDSNIYIIEPKSNSQSSSPRSTNILSGHKHFVHDIIWDENTNLFSCSFDHTIKVFYFLLYSIGIYQINKYYILILLMVQL